MQDISYKKAVFLAEEIGREVARNISYPIQPTEPTTASIIGREVVSIPQNQEIVIKTEEKRPRYPHIINYSIHEANRWYGIELPREGVKAWQLRCRENYNINYCFEPSASTYMTLSSGATLSQDTAPEGIHSIYIRCATANVTIELEVWKGAPSLDLEKEALLRLSP